MTPNPNEMPDNTLTPDVVRQFSDSMSATADAQRRQRQHTEQWPVHVNEALLAMQAKLDAHESRIAALEAGPAKA